MIDVYIGKAGVPESTLPLEFDTMQEASKFCDIVKDHYKEEVRMLYIAIDRKEEKNEV